MTRDATFVDETLAIDGRQFEGCTFERCRLIFAATAPTSFVGCSFNACQWGFTGAAALAVDLLVKLSGLLGPEVLARLLAAPAPGPADGRIH